MGKKGGAPQRAKMEGDSHGGTVVVVVAVFEFICMHMLLLLFWKSPGLVWFGLAWPGLAWCGVVTVRAERKRAHIEPNQTEQRNEMKRNGAERNGTQCNGTKRNGGRSQNASGVSPFSFFSFQACSAVAVVYGLACNRRINICICMYVCMYVRTHLCVCRERERERERNLHYWSKGGPQPVDLKQKREEMKKATYVYICMYGESGGVLRNRTAFVYRHTYVRARVRACVLIHNPSMSMSIVSLGRPPLL